jgi:hypothetical protein
LLPPTHPAGCWDLDLRSNASYLGRVLVVEARNPTEVDTHVGAVHSSIETCPRLSVDLQTLLSLLCTVVCAAVETTSLHVWCIIAAWLLKDKARTGFPLKTAYGRGLHASRNDLCRWDDTCKVASYQEHWHECGRSGDACRIFWSFDEIKQRARRSGTGLGEKTSV